MLDLGEALAQKKLRLQRLEADMEQLRGEIETLARARVILKREAAKIATAGPAPADSALTPEQSSPSTDIRKHFP